MKLVRLLALAIALLATGSVYQRPALAQAQTNKHVTTGEVKESFAGDGSTKAFILSFNPTGPAAVLVFENGLLQSEPEDYAISGKTISFSATPANGDRIRVKYVAEFNG